MTEILFCFDNELRIRPAFLKVSPLKKRCEFVVVCGDGESFLVDTIFTRQHFEFKPTKFTFLF